MLLRCVLTMEHVYILGSITGISLSADSNLLATIAVDKAIKIYDVVNFGKVNVLNELLIEYDDMGVNINLVNII